MNKNITDILKITENLHKPIPLNEENSLEKFTNTKKIQRRIPIEATSQKKWLGLGRGDVRTIDSRKINIKAKARYDSWDIGDPSDGDYVGFGKTKAYMEMNHEDWQSYDLLSFEIKSNCKNIINPNITIELKNDGEIKVPDKYEREGYHSVNLHDKELQTIKLNLNGFPRDSITELGFVIESNGTYSGTEGEINFEIANVFLEKSDSTDLIEGWRPKKDNIIFSHEGYQTDSPKLAFTSGLKADNFSIVKNDGETVFTSKISNVKTNVGEYNIADFSNFKMNGTYHIKIGNLETENFKITNDKELWMGSSVKALNFIFSERCGYPVPNIHGVCHEDVVALHKGTKMIFNGGWHDAGDLSQQLIQTAEVTQSIFELAEQYKNIDQTLFDRFIEEGKWGIDFILKTDFGEGYHATSAGVSRWTDNLQGNMDDASARVHNTPYENYILSGVFMRISEVIGAKDSMYNTLIRRAEKYYRFAEHEFSKLGFKTTPIMWEHTLNTSKATYLATMVWSGTLVNRVLKDQKIEQNIKSRMRQLILCQETDGIKLDNDHILKGMFYRDETHNVLQHFNHQSREHYFAQAFEAIITTYKDDEEFSTWVNSAKEYANYLLFLQKYTYPYAMHADGIYKEKEYTDKASFDVQHLLVDSSAKNEYSIQLQKGEKVANGFYIKKFPVWFSFRGNNGVILSAAKSAGILGNLLNKKELINVARGQLQWIIGQNPFDQSMMYGEGYRYAQQYSVSSGEIVGEIPVGIETNENTDVPYWPFFNNATYKEVWIGNVGKWLSVIAEVIKYK